MAKAKNTQPAEEAVTAAPAVETTAPATDAPEVTTAPEATNNPEAEAAQAEQDPAEEAVTAAPVDGNVKLRGANCSVDGNDYTADEDGVVTVQVAHAEVLIRDFGFERV